MMTVRSVIPTVWTCPHGYDAGMPQDRPVLRFADADEAEAWFEEHHADSDGIWVAMAKKGSADRGVTESEMLDLCLAFGWITGQRKSLDADAFLQSFVPRRPRSPWSQINRDKVADLIEAGRMRAAGLAEVERAKLDGRWQSATASPANAEVPADFLEALEGNAAAKEFFATLDKRNTFAVYYRLNEARKPETRARRIEKFVDMFARGQRIY